MEKALCNNLSDQQGKGMPGTWLDAALGTNLGISFQVARMLCTQMMQNHPAIGCHIDGEHRGFNPLPKVVLGSKGQPKSELGQSSVAAGSGIRGQVKNGRIGGKRNIPSLDSHFVDNKNKCPNIKNIL